MRNNDVLIYDGEGVAPMSVAACTEMVNNISAENKNGSIRYVETLRGRALQGLRDRVVIIPGGNAFEMLEQALQVFTREVVNGNSFLAICAGSIMCCKESKMPVRRDQKRCTPADFSPSSPTELYTIISQDDANALATVPVTAFAPCYPEEQPEKQINDDVMSVEVTSDLDGKAIRSNQYFKKGPHFQVPAEEISSIRTVATYSRAAAPAVIHSGNKVIFGFHPEAQWSDETSTALKNSSDQHACSRSHATQLVGEAFRLLEQEKVDSFSKGSFFK